MLVGGAGCNYQIAALARVFAAHQLAHRTHGVDDGAACRIRHKARQALQLAAAVGMLGEGQQIGLLRLEPCDRRFKHLRQS
jgi:hypothetical protein